MAGFTAVYFATGGTKLLLGAVPRSESSVFSHAEDAQARLDSALEINRAAGLECNGTVVYRPNARPEIVRHCPEAEAQAVGARCPKCREVV